MSRGRTVLLRWLVVMPSLVWSLLALRLWGWGGWVLATSAFATGGLSFTLFYLTFEGE